VKRLGNGSTYSCTGLEALVMNSESSAPPLTNMAVTMAAIAILLLAMRAASDILSPIFLAAVLAITASPLLNWFMKRGAPSWLALLLTLALVIIFVVGIVWLVGSSVQDFREELLAYEESIEEIKQLFGTRLTNLGVDVDTLKADPLIAPEEILVLIVSYASGIVSKLSNWGLVILTTLFFLVEETIIPRKMQNIVEDDDPDALRVLHLAKKIREYMGINAFVGILFAVLNTILLVFMGVDFAIFWGLLSFFMSFIPGIGFIIAVIPPALMALIQFGVTEMLIVFGAYLIFHSVLYSLIKPYFIQEDVNISVTVTFLSLIVWAWVLGPIGAILAVPMTIIVQAILDSREETRWMAYMMSSGSEPYEPKEEVDQVVME
jgi:predicted PurR-regulated permease PerM